MTQLRGMTWSHPRGYDPMVATAAAWRDRTGVEIVWDQRSLQDFEAFPVEELARNYDLIVIDHPHVGQVTRENCLLPLDGVDRAAEREALATQSVGASYASYTYAGRQWAFPIDAAAQVTAWRPDLTDRPEDWQDVLALARAGQVVLPLLPPHSLMCFFTLCASLGEACAVDGPGPLVSRPVAIEAIGRLAELTALLEPSNFAMDPIAASEAMARPDALVSVMPLGYGYVSYAMDGFRPHRLAFGDIPLPEARGSALGGTGIAVSALRDNQQAALDYAYWVASEAVQRGLYATAGGQPGHAAAWADAAVNAASNDFYRNTRTTLENSWVRPRHHGYMAFQEQASQRLNAGLLSKDAADGIAADFDELFKRSF